MLRPQNVIFKPVVITVYVERIALKFIARHFFYTFYTTGMNDLPVQNFTQLYTIHMYFLLLA